MKERDIQNAIMDLLLKHPMVAWAFVTTVGRFKGHNGHWFTVGYPGMSDIIGQTTNGKLLAIEVKQPGKVPTEEQIEFLTVVSKNGGIAGWADSVDEAIGILRQLEQEAA